MSMKETAKSLGIGHSMLYRLVGEGKLATHRIGGRVLVKRSDVEALLTVRPPAADARKRGRRRV